MLATICINTAGLHHLVNNNLVMSLPFLRTHCGTVGARMWRDLGLAVLVLLSAAVESNSELKSFSALSYLITIVVVELDMQVVLVLFVCAVWEIGLQ